MVVVGYALGPLVIARRPSDLPALEVVAVSLTLWAVVYAPIGIALLPQALPPLRIPGAIAGLGVVCTALAFVLSSVRGLRTGRTRASGARRPWRRKATSRSGRTRPRETDASQSCSWSFTLKI